MGLTVAALRRRQRFRCRSKIQRTLFAGATSTDEDRHHTHTPPSSPTTPFYPHLGMPDVQVSVGLGWEARHDPSPGGREVLSQLLRGVGDAHNAAIAEGDRGVNLGRGGPGNHRISPAEWCMKAAMLARSRLSCSHCAHTGLPVHSPTYTHTLHTWLLSAGLGRKA